MIHSRLIESSRFRPERLLLRCAGRLGFSAALMVIAMAGIARANQVTFGVDVEAQRSIGHFDPARGDTVLVSGNFSTPDWTTTSVLSASGSNTNVYAGTFNNDIPAGSTIQYKFIINPGGNSTGSQLIWESGNNRTVQATTANQTLPTVYFNNLAPGSTVATNVTFMVNLESRIASGDFNPALDSVSVACEALNNWSTTAAPLTNSPLQPNLWRGTFPITNAIGNTLNYKFVIRPQSGGVIWEDDGVGPDGVQNRQFTFSGAAIVHPLVDFNNESVPLEFIAGADMSHLFFFQDRGITYRANGVVRDALKILQERGVNCIRLRLFTSSAAQAAADPYNATNNLDYILPLAVRVKNAGLKLLLDFHYSDSWADPGKQTKPAAWTNLNFTQLKAEIRTYSSNVIAAFNAVGAMPEYVQVGNEITPGLLWNDGRVGGSNDTPTQWSRLGQLLTSAVQGIKDAAGMQMPKIIIHIDRGGDWGSTRWFFDNLTAQQVPFDIIGQSYYPWWHGSPAALSMCLTNAALRYGRPIMVVETAFPRGNSTNVFGIPATTNGQVQFVVELAKIVKSVPNRKGTGIFWWGTEYQELAGYSLAGFHYRSFFGPGGDVLPVAEALGALTAPVAITPTRSNDVLILRWPLSGAGMKLKSSTELAPATWTNTTNGVESTGTVFQTRQSIGNDPFRFYRLESD